MAREVYQFTVKVPAGTPPSAPQTTDLTMPVGMVRRISVRIPPGPRGWMGFQIAAAGTQIVPMTAGEWILGDDETLTWDVDGYIESGAWQVIQFDTGAWQHSLQVRFEVDPAGQAVAPLGVSVPLLPSAIAAPGAGATSGLPVPGDTLPGVPGAVPGIPPAIAPPPAVTPPAVTPGATGYAFPPPPGTPNPPLPAPVPLATYRAWTKEQQDTYDVLNMFDMFDAPPCVARWLIVQAASQGGSSQDMARRAASYLEAWSGKKDLSPLRVPGLTFWTAFGWETLSLPPGITTVPPAGFCLPSSPPPGGAVSQPGAVRYLGPPVVRPPAR